ncbi:MAG TPA: hypothetical protein VLG36_03950 [Candidatus Chromulinivoraceae bacterium]|nr:hypothetical protein [Candidatus Chromulinivoraceae bacterium]
MGDQYWSAAHLLWSLGTLYPAMSNLNLSIELFLRAVWLKEQQFDTEEGMNRGLNGFGRSLEDNKPHDYSAMLSKLPDDVRDRLVDSGIEGFVIIDDKVVRYGESPIMGYSNKHLYKVDKFIKFLRNELNYPSPKSNYDLIAKNVHVYYTPQNQPRALRGVKLILGASHLDSQKKERRKLRKILERIRKRSQ